MTVAMMKAVVFDTFGGSDVLRYVDVSVPEPGASDVLVRVRAVGLNRLDLQVRMGQAGEVLLPHIGGCEVAGEVALLGDAVQGIEVGQKVVVAPYLFCGVCSRCKAGEEMECVKGGMLGVKTNGGFAEYVVVPANSLVPMPEDMEFTDAAAVSLSALTAWHMLVSKAGIHPGETVLILAAGSGVGSAGIGIAKLWGTHVIATAGSAEKLAKAQELGADDVINYAEQDFAAEVMRLTDGRGVDIVLEHTGADTWSKSVACVANNGRIVVCGATTGATASIDLALLSRKQIMVIGAFRRHTRRA